MAAHENNFFSFFGSERKQNFPAEREGEREKERE
jgi:hypothetical protein